MSETGINKLILLAASVAKSVLFRNNVGTGWIGKSIRLAAGQVYRAKGGEMVITNPRPLHAGLVTGSSDNIGWVKIIVTPEMVGMKLAVFLAVESKVPHVGKLSKEQKHWITVVNTEGGVAFIATSPEDFTEQINNYKKSIGN